MDICGGQAVFLPTSECDECEALLERIRALEARLEGKTDIEIEVVDTDGSTVATVIGYAERSDNV